MRGYKDVEVRHADQFFDAFEEAVPLTAIIPAWSAMKRTKVACAISDQMILTGSRRTPQS